jgi:ABC-2 type transport system ATP-binding protein
MTVISGKGLGKRYLKVIDKPTILGSLISIGRSKGTELWAVKDVDIDVEAGESVAIIGRNGSGKTTMLKILSGVTQPTVGRLEVNGRVAPLIGIGVGFRKEMSGRENVLLNGMLLGLTRREVESNLESIVGFAELWDFIDTPVKFYSSGMYLRLGFSVAVHTNPDIMLVDEILAVGDLSFQVKCLDRLRAIQASGTTIVMVSHSLQAVRSLCSRALLLRAGSAVFDGDTETAIAKYYEQIASETQHEEEARSGQAHMLLGGVTILERELLGRQGAVKVATRGERLELRLHVRFDRAIESPMFGMDLFGEGGQHVYGIHTPVNYSHRTYEAGEEADLKVTFTPRLGGGTYRLTSQVMTMDGRGVLATDQSGLYLFLDGIPWVSGLADLDGIPTIDGVPFAAVPSVAGTRETAQ